MVSNKLGELPSNTSGAIQAALPLLLVMWVWASHAVPKSQIFNTVPPPISSRLTHSTNDDIRNLTNIQHMQLLSGILNGNGSSIKDVHKNTEKSTSLPLVHFCKHWAIPPPPPVDVRKHEYGIRREVTQYPRKASDWSVADHVTITAQLPCIYFPYISHIFLIYFPVYTYRLPTQVSCLRRFPAHKHLFILI